MSNCKIAARQLFTVRHEQHSLTDRRHNRDTDCSLAYPEKAQQTQTAQSAESPATQAADRARTANVLPADGTLTDCTVFAQVPLAALLTTSDHHDRNRYDRKIADFLICTKTLTPIAVIELDDSTHDNKIAKDADRDAMLRNAGYQTIRYRNYPSPDQLRQDIENAFKKVAGLTPQTAQKI